MKEKVYLFSEERAEGKELGRNILGGKGANLIEMAGLGIPVPPGIVITTDACKEYIEKKHSTNGLSEDLKKEIKCKLQDLENSLPEARKLGSETKPLLVSVRSGAPVSMPGMMDTILNLGLNQKTVEGLSEETENEQFALDSYRRFIQMFGNVVLEIDHSEFEQILENHKKQEGIQQDFELKAQSIRRIIDDYQELIHKKTGKDFPEDTTEQLHQAIEAVFSSWNNERAVFYRRLNNIPHDLGTAVTIQSMVFGNMGNDSATGVAFTRDPSTGEKSFYGEYLINAQGEDVVAGIRTPKPISLLEKDMPSAYQKLFSIQERLEDHFRDMQDIEFTIQQNKLYLLQTRNGKRTSAASLRIAVEMYNEGKIDVKKALMQVDPTGLPSLLTPVFSTQLKQNAIQEGKLIGRGLNAGPGAASGTIILDSSRARQASTKGEKVILVRAETSPEDIIGMQHSVGILTARGGMTSHAAVVARGMNKPCIVGCSSLRIDLKGKSIRFITDEREVELKEGDELSIDGSSGEIIQGSLSTEPSEIDQLMNQKVDKPSLTAKYFLTIMEWADKYRRLMIRANADTPQDAKTARFYGAQGIGLCRTEHMFFEKDRIMMMRQMILAENQNERKKVLSRLLEYQKDDFIHIFEVMEGLPVTIRLLDPPLHEFLPHSHEQDVELSKHINLSPEEIYRRSKLHKEDNPMLGHRGCRLGITFPEITQTQARAVLEAASIVQKKGIRAYPEIMVPLVGHPKEFVLQKQLIDSVAEEVFNQTKETIEYSVGTMIEVPRATVQAGKIASHAQFFSFGTNDLTQMTLAFSRDDSGVFLQDYIEHGIYEANPFETLDQEGVGELIKIAIERGRKVRKDLKIGICGEHGGDPKSIDFFHHQGLDYVSCSPFRVPVARLAAARVAISDSS